MTISQLIRQLQAAMREHGDLAVCTPYAEISAVITTPARDGARCRTDGSSAEPNELILDLIPVW